MGFETLSDGKAVMLRPPTVDDLERMLAFFRALPEHERRYLRFDVTNADRIRRILEDAGAGRTHRLIALDDDTIIGHALLEYDPDAWTRHLGEIRVQVAPEHRKRSLGRLLISAMVHLAQRVGLAAVITKIPAPQAGVRSLCERLGFRFDAVLPAHMVDAQGNYQDLVVMSCPLDEVSSALRDFCRDENWPDG